MFPENVELILKRLVKSGYEAYVVGGCVRDYLRNEPMHDWDITTNALPFEIQALFSEYTQVLNGIKHGTVGVIIGKNNYEITTFRIDGEYVSNRFPEKVTFVKNLYEDLLRRDFTINAMAMDINGKLYDYFGGKEDIDKGIIRAVGNPYKRFSEDGLRIMRALRFAAVLNYKIENKTQKALLEEKSLLLNISAERITSEFNKIMCSDNPQVVLNDYKEVFAVFLPEIRPMFTLFQANANHNQFLWTHTLRAVSNTQADLILRLTMLFHDIAKPDCKKTDEAGIDHYYNHAQLSAQKAENILDRMKYSKMQISNIILLIKYHDSITSKSRHFVKKMLQKLGEDNCRKLIKVRKADILAQSSYNREEKLLLIEGFSSELEDTIKSNECFSLKQLKINGNDLKNIGITDGKEIGEILRRLLEEVTKDNSLNDGSTLLKMAKKKQMR